MKPLADFCRRNQIALVIPFSIESQEVESNPQVFQVYQTDSLLNAMAVHTTELDTAYARGVDAQ